MYYFPLIMPIPPASNTIMNKDLKKIKNTPILQFFLLLYLIGTIECSWYFD